MTRTYSGEVAFVLYGPCGGIRRAGETLASLLHGGGYFVSGRIDSHPSGTQECIHIRASNRSARGISDRFDVIFPFAPDIPADIAQSAISETIIAAPRDILADCSIAADVRIPLPDPANDGERRFFLAAGFAAGLLRIESSNDSSLNLSPDERESLENGRSLGAAQNVKIKIPVSMDTRDLLVTGGSESVALGALAAECSVAVGLAGDRATGTLRFLSGSAGRERIAVEEADDCDAISAIALRSSRGGDRVLVSVPASLSEEFALRFGSPRCGETVPVIHLEHGASGVSYGAFPPRTGVFFAPGTPDEGFFFTKRAFDLAERHCIPAIVSTDAGFSDAFVSNPPFHTRHLLRERTTGENTPPRCARIREDAFPPAADARALQGTASVTQVEEAVMRDALPPSRLGDPEAPVLICCTGGILHSLHEALLLTGRCDVSILHFRQLSPLHPDIATALGTARFRVVAGNDPESLRGLLGRRFGVSFDAGVAIRETPPTVEAILRELQHVLP